MELKIFSILLCILFFTQTLAQTPNTTNLTFSLGNEQIINGGAAFQFDVLVQANQAGTYFARSQVYVNYNSLGFGSSIAGTANVSISGILSGQVDVFGTLTDRYNLVNVANNTASSLAITIESNFLSAGPNPIPHAEISTSPSRILRITLPIVDNSQTAGVSLAQPLMSGEQYGIIASNSNEAYNTIQTNNNGLPMALLPVELLSFQAKAGEQSIHLEWVVATEINFSGYELQRSIDQSQFGTIAWVPGKGTSSEQTYTHLDEDVVPESPYYYRLRMVDLDGKIEYSDIRFATLANSQKLTVKVFPNVIESGSNVRIKLMGENEGRIRFFDSTGKLIGFVLLKEGNQVVSTSNWPTGNYFYSVQTKSFIRNGHLIVQ